MKAIVLRKVMGETLRELRMEQGLTLREVSLASTVSLGYLSEIERGHKEPSSEVLWSIASALAIELSDLLMRVSEKVAELEAGDSASVALAA